MGLSGEVTTTPAILRPPSLSAKRTLSAIPSGVRAQASSSRPGASRTLAPMAYGPQL